MYPLREEIRFYPHLMLMSIRNALSKRGAFLLEMFMMVVNNLVFFSMWWLFFREIKNVGGWEIRDMMVLNAVGSGAFGIKECLFGGLRTLAGRVSHGELDAYLTRPKNVLLHLLGSRSQPRGAGYLLTAFLMLYFAKVTDPLQLLLILFCMFTGCSVFIAAGVIAHSIVFWIGPSELLSKKYCDTLFLFSLYPGSIYSGWTQLAMYTVLPAAIIGFMPVELAREFSWARLGILVGFSTLLLIAAMSTFYRGLLRYESGASAF